MTFTPQEIEELKRDGWEWVEVCRAFRNIDILGGCTLWLTRDGTVEFYDNMSPDLEDGMTPDPTTKSFSTLQELREFFGLGVEG